MDHRHKAIEIFSSKKVKKPLNLRRNGLATFEKALAWVIIANLLTEKKKKKQTSFHFDTTENRNWSKGC